MTEVHYSTENGVATLAMDDGKVNALSPAMLGALGEALDRAVGLAEAFTPETAVAAGFLDVAVEPERVLATSRSVAASLGSLDPAAHVGSKRRARRLMLEGLRSGIEAEFSPTPSAASR